MKDKQEKLETEVVDMEKEGIDVEIEQTNEQIAELQDKLSLATLRKEAKEHEIDGLRS